MSAQNSETDLDALRGLQGSSAPAPSAALLASLQTMKPVRTRVPLLTLLLVAAAGCAFPAYAFAMFPLRRDLSALPPAWVAGMALFWLAGFLVPLTLAVLPSRHQVLPNSTWAMRAAVLASTVLVLIGLLFTVDAPGVTILPKTTWDQFVDLWWHCVSFGLKVSVPMVLLGGLILRRVNLFHLRALGAAIGAAGGALAGLTLHGLCPYGGAVHVGLAHGGGVVIGALVGALWLPFLARAGRRA